MTTCSLTYSARRCDSTMKARSSRLVAAPPPRESRSARLLSTVCWKRSRWPRLARPVLRWRGSIARSWTCSARKGTMSLADRHRSRTLTDSQRDWLRVREYLQQHRYELGLAAAEEYPNLLTVPESPLLTRQKWLPSKPLRLDAIDLQFAPESPFTGLISTEPATASVRPNRSDG